MKKLLFLFVLFSASVAQSQTVVISSDGKRVYDISAIVHTADSLIRLALNGKASTTDLITLQNLYTALGNSTATSISNIQTQIGTMSSSTANSFGNMATANTTLQGQITANSNGITSLQTLRLADSINNAQQAALQALGLGQRMKYTDTAGMLGSYLRTATFTAGIANAPNWNTAYSWGNHAVVGYAAGAALTALQSLVRLDSGRINTNIANISTLATGKLDATSTAIGTVLGYAPVSPTGLSAATAPLLSSAAAATLYKPIGYVPAWSEITNKPNFSTVATTGTYGDLLLKPILTRQTQIDSNAVAIAAVKTTNDSLRTVMTTQANQIASLTATNGTLPIYNAVITLTSTVATYTVNHGLGYKPAAIVPVSSNNIAATSPNVNPATITATTFQVSFAGVPTVASIAATGANLTFYYLAIK